MSQLSMYQASIPVLTRALKNLRGVLCKAIEHTQSKQISDSELLQTRLIPDMFPLLRQVQIASEIACRGAARLSNVELPKFEDNEQTFEQLLVRIDTSLAYLRGFSAQQIDGSETRSVQFKIHDKDYSFTGKSFLTDFVLPNVYFHCTTAYNILRQEGVPLGKADFLGAA